MLNWLFILSILVLNLNTQGSNPEIILQVKHANSDEGWIRVLIFSEPKGFPDQIEKAMKSYSIKPKNKSIELDLSDIPEGRYAITAIHDEDGNGKLTTNSLGYPLEKYGFSNNPKVYFSSPSFEKVAIQVGKTSKRILINLR